MRRRGERSVHTMSPMNSTFGIAAGNGGARTPASRGARVT
jgi:hypothetical protein